MQDEILSGWDYWGPELKMFFGNVWMGEGEGMKESRKSEGRIWFEMEDIMCHLTIPRESESIPIHAGINAAQWQIQGACLAPS